jgi:hypothetical protein
MKFLSSLRYALILVLAGDLSTSHAAVHLWQVREAFTNADGSVQFIEMFDANFNEHFTAFTTLTANSDGNIKTFTFPSNSSATPGAMLIATSGFGSLTGGVTPDFTFSQSTTPFTGPFFNPNATNITITFSANGDSISFTGASLPKDGIHSLTDANAFGLFPEFETNLGSTDNSPTNLAGASGSVNLSTPSPTGDYNGNHTVDAADYIAWRNRLNETGLTPGSGPDGSGNGTVDLADYTFWRSKFGNAAGSGSASAAPEPMSGALLLLGVLSLRLARRRR